MSKHSKQNEKIIKKPLIIVALVIVIATIIIFSLRYNVEGEKNLPFIITNIRIISTAQANIVGDNQNDLNIIQSNDFYFYLEKNPKYKKEDSISKITFENFNIEKTPSKGVVSIYKPSFNTTPYLYSDEYKIDNSISYFGGLNTNLASLEIGNQGGLIGFSVALNDLGIYTKTDDTVTYDGTILSKLNLTNEDIALKISFDMIIETSSNKKFKSTLQFDLPTGNIIEEGRTFLDKNNLDDIVFKRF